MHLKKAKYTLLKTKDQERTNTNTHFFRESKTLEMIIQKIVVPKNKSGEKVSIWCVGCSTGDEPYSLAIEICETSNHNVEILATDIRTDIIKKARRGRYQMWNMRHVKRQRRERWFDKKGSEFELKKAVRKKVTIKKNDVVRDPPLWPRNSEGDSEHGWDVILVRNVLIYYDAECLKQALISLTSVLKPNGLLILSACEYLSASSRNHLPPSAQLQLDEINGVVVYRKTATNQEEDTSRSTTKSTFKSYFPKPPPKALKGNKEAPIEPIRNSIRTALFPADLLLDNGQAAAALELVNNALKKDPVAFDLHLRKGLCYLELEQFQMAKDAFRHALFLQPKCWLPAWLLGDLLAEESPQNAIRYFLQAKSILTNPENDDFDEAKLGFIIQLGCPNKTVALEAINARLDVLTTVQNIRQAAK